jgi:WD40 repeat protein
MSERTVSERVLESILEERAGGGAPADLRASILAAVREEELRAPRSMTPTGRWRRDNGRTLRLLAVAAVLATAAGGALVVGAGRTTQDSRPAPTSAVAPSPAPSAPAVVAGLNECFMMTNLATELGIEPGPGPVVGAPASSVPVNGDLFAGITADPGYALVRIDPSLASTTPVATGLSDPLGRIASSPDGRTLAVEVSSHYFEQCQAPLLMSLPDGPFWQPFLVGRNETVTEAAWAHDGSRLFAIHAGYTNATDGDMGSIVAWDAMTGAIAKLGSPCDGCRLGSLLPSPDGTRLAVVYVGLTCALSQDTSVDPDAWQSACPDSGVAVLDATGAWESFPAETLRASIDGVAWLDGLIGWADGRTLVFGAMGSSPGIATYPIDGAAKGTFFPGPPASWSDLLGLSPDGSAVAVTAGVIGEKSPVIALIDVRDGSIQVVGPIPEQAAYAVTWAPDGRSIAVLSYSSKQADITQLVVLPLDGSPPRVRTLPCRPDDGHNIAWPSAP